MPASPLSRRPAPALVIVLLVLAAAVTAGLSVEIVRSARAAREAAEGVLRGSPRRVAARVSWRRSLRP